MAYNGKKISIDCIYHRLYEREEISQIKKDKKRGSERIRTAVRAFAELCLAARPPDHYLKEHDRF